eukprot:Hpha_TRINITY_DN18776_c0_g1::TRINITY_DN18776_c0_g1_i1::g.47488::m.47488
MPGPGLHVRLPGDQASPPRMLPAGFGRPRAFTSPQAGRSLFIGGQIVGKDLSPQVHAWAGQGRAHFRDASPSPAPPPPPPSLSHSPCPSDPTGGSPLTLYTPQQSAERAAHYVEVMQQPVTLPVGEGRERGEQVDKGTGMDRVVLVERATLVDRAPQADKCTLVDAFDLLEREGTSEGPVMLVDKATSTGRRKVVRRRAAAATLGRFSNMVVRRRYFESYRASIKMARTLDRFAVAARRGLLGHLRGVAAETLAASGQRTSLRACFLLLEANRRLRKRAAVRSPRRVTGRRRWGEFVGLLMRRSTSVVLSRYWRRLQIFGATGISRQVALVARNSGGPQDALRQQLERRCEALQAQLKVLSERADCKAPLYP